MKSNKKEAHSHNGAPQVYGRNSRFRLTETAHFLNETGTLLPVRSRFRTGLHGKACKCREVTRIILRIPAGLP